MSLPQQVQLPGPVAHMIVCGDDALAHRLAAELRQLYGEPVTLVVPPGTGYGTRRPASPGPRGEWTSALLGRMTAAVARRGVIPDEQAEAVILLEADEPHEEVLREAGVERAEALALVYDDDEINIRAALTARRLNPRLRLVIRLYNRKLGQHLEALLDQAAAVADPGIDPQVLDASTTVLSDADTAAPALAASAIAGTSKVVQADGLLLRAVERTPPGRGQVADEGLCTLALLSSTVNDPAGSEGSDRSGTAGPQLLPDARTVAAATGRRTVVLEAIAPASTSSPPRGWQAPGVPLGSLFSRRLLWSVAGIGAAALGLAVSSWLTTGGSPLHAGYLTLLDLFAIDDPAVAEPASRKVIQLFTGLMGLLLLPVLVAGVLEALGAFRSASALRRPPRGLSGHVVLLGLGKVGARVLARLLELGIPVVCVENDPQARGLALARRLHVPVVLGDVAQEGVLEAARIHRAHALLALTSSDTTNLEAALSARSVKPDLRVSMRLYDDDFATAVYRTLRAAHPDAVTRSRSVSHLAAPAFGGAMMGRQILGAIPVERKVLLFAAVEVAGHQELEGRTVAEAFRPGSWRVLALDTSAPGHRTPDLATARSIGYEPADRPADLVWELPDGYILQAQDRVVLAATRRGLAELLGRRSLPLRP